MGLKDAITWGLGRAWRAPRLVLGLWLLNVLAAFPAALLMSTILADSIGDSRFHAGMRDGFDTAWYAEFQIEEDGLAETFQSSIIAHGAVLNNLENWWSGRLLDNHVGLVALGLAYLVLWAFLLGGVVEVLRRPEGPRSYVGFTAACGGSFRRYLSLVLMSGVLYLLIFRLSTWLYGKLADATQELTVERTLFWQAVSIAVVIIGLLHLIRMVFDVAKIAVVVHDIGALRALYTAVRFVAGRPGSACAAYGAPTLLVLALTTLYAVVAPGVAQANWATVLLAFLVAQVYLAAKIGLRIAVLGSQMRLYRSS
jgi:hypothetical protein